MLSLSHRKFRLLGVVWASLFFSGLLFSHAVQLLSASQTTHVIGERDTAVSSSALSPINTGITGTLTTTLYLPLMFSPPPTTSLQPIQAVCATNTWTLTWSDGGSTVYGYELQEAHESMFTQPVTTVITQTQYTAAPAPAPVPQNLYYYRARNLTSVGSGPWSNTQSIVGGYLDTFTDPNSGWSQADEPGFTYEYVDNEYRILGRSAGLLYRPISPNYLLDTYTVQADIHWWGTPPESLYGLVFGVVQDISQYYLFSVYADTQEYRLHRRLSDGSFVQIVPRTVAAEINTGSAVNHLAVTWDSGQITLMINGVVVNTLTDPVPITGLTGTGIAMSTNLINAAVDARYDDFQVIGCLTPADTDTSTTIHQSMRPVITTFDHWTEE